MTEDDWLASGDPRELLRFLLRGRRGRRRGRRNRRPPAASLSDRKSRLFTCACCRLVWHLLKDERSRAAVEVAERFADGLVDEDERARAHQAANEALDVGAGPVWLPWYAVWYGLQPDSTVGNLEYEL